MILCLCMDYMQASGESKRMVIKVICATVCVTTCVHAPCNGLNEFITWVSTESLQGIFDKYDSFPICQDDWGLFYCKAHHLYLPEI